MAAARERAPGRSFGWVLVAAASLVGLVGAWFTVRSVGGDAAPPMTQVDQLARYQPDAGPTSGRYRLRGAEVRTPVESDDTSGDATRGLRGAQYGLSGGDEAANREGVATLEERRNEVTATEQEIPLGARDKTGQLDSGEGEDGGRDFTESGAAFHADSLGDGLKVLDSKVAAEVVEKETKVIANLDSVIAPANVRIDGDGRSTVSLGEGQDQTVASDANARGEDAWRVAGPASANPPDDAGGGAPGKGETKALAQQVKAVASGEHAVVVSGDGYDYQTGTVVTRVPAVDNGLVLLPADAAGEPVDTPVVTDPAQRELSEVDRRVAREAVGGQRQRELYWWRSPQDGRGGPGGDDELTGGLDADASQREEGEGARASSRTVAGPEFARLAGKAALVPRALVPPAGAVEGLAELSPRGYFRNTYLPGDPESSWLRASLADRLTRDGAELPLERAARPPVQPFTASADRGLGVSVTADRAAVAGPTRMTVQIGLAGADRPATRRAPLNLALVLDVAAVSSEAERQALWSLADALAAGRQPGDRLAVLVTGAAPQDAQVLSASELSGPEVRRALATAFEARQAPA
ncbi:MAG: hypothetical protein CVU56_28065, partial [Deltaproteobacteria bacterium HGW-Deltaproteobacteria-14]